MTEHNEIQETAVVPIELLTNDRPERFNGTRAEIVEAMKNTAFAPMPDSAAYIERFARYAKMVEGHEIRTSNATDFIRDLMACGLARMAPRMS